MEKQVTEYAGGNEIAAIAIKQIGYDLMGYYPITPSTQIAENLDDMRAKGETDLIMIAAEGEHSAAGICYGAADGVNATQANKMRLSGLDRIMDGVFVSELMGYPKPRKEFFDGCFAALSDVDRNKCILVGDSLTSDMRGAENAGIASCWFNPEKQEKDVDVRTDYEIRRLEELISILEQE